MNRFWVILIFYLIANVMINLVAASPVFSMPLPIPALDKAAHFVVSAGMAYWLNGCWQQKKVMVFGYPFLAGSLFVFFLVTIEEFSQVWMPARTFSFLDLLCSYSGIAVCGRGCAPTQNTKTGKIAPDDGNVNRH